MPFIGRREIERERGGRQMLAGKASPRRCRCSKGRFGGKIGAGRRANSAGKTQAEQREVPGGNRLGRLGHRAMGQQGRSTIHCGRVLEKPQTLKLKQAFKEIVRMKY